MGKDVIVACDFNSEKELVKFLNQMEGANPDFYCKIGMELFDSGALQGFNPIQIVKKRGHKVFLDLKLKDIPNTVSKTAKVFLSAGVDMMNIHADGGLKMMKDVVDSINEECAKHKCDKPILLGVTVLTSMSEKELRNEVGVNKTPMEQVVHLAKLCKEAGLDGVVCSPQEIIAVKEACGKKFLTVVPGIRFADSKKDDQTRVATPSCANIMGSDYIVVGRPITAAQNPVEVYNKCQCDFIAEKHTQEEIINAHAYIEDLKTKNHAPSDIVAQKLIEAEAFKINTEDPYLLKSGVGSPLYCNCRDLYKSPQQQKIIMDYLAQLVRESFPSCEAIFGTPMSAISFGALVAERLGVPFGFVRSEKKDHGMNTQIEGPTRKGIKAVIVEDLITTGVSSLQPTLALKNAGAEVLGVVGIVDNNFVSSTELTENGIIYHTVTNMSKIAHYAGEQGIIDANAFEKIKAYEDNPKDESWMSASAAEKIKAKRLARK